MTLEALFKILNGAAGLSWLLLALAPRWQGTRILVRSGAVSVLFSLVYLTLFAVYWGDSEGGFDSITAVAKLFENPAILLAGWVHYLAFDLLVGVWMTARAEELKAPRIAVAGCQFLTFMFGPVGYLAFRGLEALQRRRMA